MDKVPWEHYKYTTMKLAVDKSYKTEAEEEEVRG